MEMVFILTNLKQHTKIKVILFSLLFISPIFGFNIHYSKPGSFYDYQIGSSFPITDVVLKAHSPYGIPIYGVDWYISSGSYQIPERNTDNLTNISNITDIYIHDGLVEINFATYSGNGSLNRPYPNYLSREISEDTWNKQLYINILINSHSEYQNEYKFKQISYCYHGSFYYVNQCDNSYSIIQPDTIEFYIGYDNLDINTNSSRWFSSGEAPGNFTGYIWSRIVNDSTYYIEGDDNIWFKRNIGSYSPIETLIVDSLTFGDFGTFAISDTALHGGEPKSSCRILNVHSEPFDTLFYYIFSIYNSYHFNSMYSAPIYALFKPFNTTATKYFTDSLFIKNSTIDAGLYYIAGYKNYIIGYLYMRDGDSLKPIISTPDSLFYHIGIYEILDTTKHILSWPNDYKLVNMVYQYREKNGSTPPNNESYDMHPLKVSGFSIDTFKNIPMDMFSIPKICASYTHIEEHNNIFLFSGPFTYWVLFNRNIADTGFHITNVDNNIKRNIYRIIGNCCYSPYKPLLDNHYQTMQTDMYNNGDTINIIYRDFDGNTMLSTLSSSGETLNQEIISGDTVGSTHERVTFWKYLTTTYPDIRNINERRWRFYIDTINYVSNYYGNTIPNINLEPPPYGSANTNILTSIMNNAKWVECYPCILTNKQDTRTPIVTDSDIESHNQSIKYSICNNSSENAGNIDSLSKYLDSLVISYSNNILTGCLRNHNISIDSCNVEMGNYNRGDLVHDSLFHIDANGSDSIIHLSSSIFENYMLAEFLINKDDIDSIFSNDTIYFGGGFKIEWICDDYLDYIRIMVFDTTDIDTQDVYVEDYIDNLNPYKFYRIYIPSYLHIDKSLTDSVKLQFFVKDQLVLWNGIIANIYILLGNYSPFRGSCSQRILYTDIGAGNQEFLNSAWNSKISTMYWGPKRNDELYRVHKNHPNGFLQYIPYFNDIFVVQDDPNTCEHKYGIIMSDPTMNNIILKYKGAASNGIILNNFYTHPDSVDSVNLHLKDAGGSPQFYRKIGW